jgi:hypothetical protein
MHGSDACCGQWVLSVPAETELHIFTSDNARFDSGGVRRLLVCNNESTCENVTWAVNENELNMEKKNEMLDSVDKGVSQTNNYCAVWCCGIHCWERKQKQGRNTEGLGRKLR